MKQYTVKKLRPVLLLALEKDGSVKAHTHTHTHTHIHIHTNTHMHTTHRPTVSEAQNTHIHTAPFFQRLTKSTYSSTHYCTYSTLLHPGHNTHSTHQKRTHLSQRIVA